MPTAFERIQAIVAGEQLDRPPVSLWRHFPIVDQTADGLAAATLAWQRAFGFDLIKLMPPGDYPTIDWGAESVYRGSPGGTRETTRFPVTTPEDWARLASVPVDRGMFRVVIEAARLVRAAIGDSVPILQTVFSPLTVAVKLSGGRVFTHLQEHPDLVRQGLEIITAVTRAFVAATLDRGAHGLFFATQCATADVLSRETYATFGVPYDLAVLEAAAGAFPVLLHLHGAQPFLDLARDYPVHIVNWHDRRAGPSLAEGAQRTGRAVAGGIDERAILFLPPTEAAAQARDTVAQCAGHGLLVAPGCVIPVATPWETVRAVVTAVRGRNDGELLRHDADSV